MLSRISNLLINKEKGFTLIEILTAIFFIAVIITGVLVLYQQIIVWNELSLYKLTALYLAQEGIEIVRNIRDTNWIEGESWDKGLDAGSWGADYKSHSLVADYATSSLLFDGNFYNYSSGNPTIFKREIKIEKPTTDKIKVTVIVSWKKRGHHQVKVEEFLYNWVQ